jgi:hypothetical protein
MAAQKTIFLLTGFLMVFARHASAFVEPGTPGAMLSFSVPAASSDQPVEEAHPIPVVLNRSVEAYIEYFTTRGKMGLQAWFNNSGSYLPVMKEIFRNQNLPEELAYVAMIESGLDPRAVSRANAVGLWQLMPDTARQHRLRGDQWVDERRDLVKSTRAAARHFRFLHDRLESWPLALSAYNAGLTTVRAAIRGAGSDDFWDLRESGRLARETRHYVPKFMAVVLIARDPAAYGFRVPPPRQVRFDSIAVPAATDLRELAGAIGITYEKINSLNPEMNGPYTPADGSSYLLKIPEGKKKAYLRAGNRPGQKMTAFEKAPPACPFRCAKITDGILHEQVSHWLTNPSAYDGMINSNEAAATEKLLMVGLNRRKIIWQAIMARGIRRGDGVAMEKR